MAGFLNSLLIAISTKGDISGLQKTDKAVQKTTKSLQGMARNTGLLTGLSQKLFGGINIHSFVNMGKSYLQFEKDLGAIRSRFFAITNDELKAKEEFEWIQKVATDTASDIKGVADSYSIFFSAAQRNLGGEGARQIFKQWTEINRVLHLSNEQFKSVTYALREMSSKGTLYSQDLKIQLGTHVPDAVGIATEAIRNLDIEGVKTIEDFQKKFKNSTEMMAKFLKSFSNVASARFASPEALQKAMLQPDALAQSIINFRWLFGKAFSDAGGSKIIIDILSSVLNIIKKIDFKSLSKNLAVIAECISKLAVFLINNIGIIVFLLQSMLAYNISKGIGKVAGIISKLFGLKGVSKFANRSLLAGQYGPLASALSAGLLRTGAKFNWKFISTRLLGFLGGPWGMLAGILISFTPQIFTMIKKIASSFIKDDNNRKQLFSDFISTITNMDPDSALNMFRNIHSKGISNTEELHKQLALAGMEKFIQYATLNDNGNIILNIGEAKLNLDDIIKGSIDGANKAKKDKADGFFNKPSITKERAKAVKGF